MTPGNEVTTAVAVVRGHPKFPKTAGIIASPFNGGCGIILNINDKQEVFVHKTYALAAHEACKWLETRAEPPQLRKANRRERREMAALQRKKKAEN